MNSAIIQLDKDKYADVIKVGFLRKGKRGKRRYFVLHQDSYKSPARIDCYDSDKRFYQGNVPKLSVPLKQCFNINKKEDGKLKHCIAIYTKADCLLLGCADEHDQEAWLQTLLGVLANTQSTGEPDDFVRPNYEHVWNVKIQKNRGITEKTPYLAGLFRFCLDCYAVHFHRINSDDEYYEFPLVYISNYGHQGNMFFLRIGRSALTGSGELWMNTEDVMDAANIHETMKQILEENHELRQRNMAVEPRAKFYSGTAPSSSNSAARSYSLSGAAQSSRELMSAIGDARSRSISESEKTLQTLRNHLSNLKSRSVTGVALAAHCLQNVNSYPAPGATALSYFRSASHSPLQRLSGVTTFDGGALRLAGYSTDSMATGSTCSDVDRGRLSARKPSKQDMDLELISCTIAGGSSSSATNGSLLNGKDSSADYCSNGGTTIMHRAEVHSPAADYLDTMRRMTLDSGCVDAVSPRRDSSSSSSYLMHNSYSGERGVAEYTPMAPALSDKSSSVTDGCSCNNDDGRSCCPEYNATNPLPSRAYSCGSKPSARGGRSNRHQQSSSWLKKLPLPHFDDRKRAHSFGNWNKNSLMNNAAGLPSSTESFLRHRSDSLGASDQSVEAIHCRMKRLLRSKLIHYKFSSGSEDMVEMDFGTGESSSFGRSHSGSLDSADSANRSRANSYLPRVERMAEQEKMRPSARLVQDFLKQEPPPALGLESEYVPMCPYESTVEPAG